MKEIQGIIKDYFENLHSNKLKNLEEMDKFLDTCDTPILNQENSNHLNRSITSNEIESAIKSLPKRKVQYVMDSLLIFFQTFKEKLISTLLKLSSK
jgi:hypothetical protein